MYEKQIIIYRIFNTDKTEKNQHEIILSLSFLMNAEINKRNYICAFFS